MSELSRRSYKTKTKMRVKAGDRARLAKLIRKATVHEIKRWRIMYEALELAGIDPLDGGEDGFEAFINFSATENPDATIHGEFSDAQLIGWLRDVFNGAWRPYDTPQDPS